MKINYDFDNIEHQQIVEDYYFIKYFVKCLKSEWKTFYETTNDKTKAIHIIINHQNKVLMEKLILLYLYYFRDWVRVRVRVRVIDRVGARAGERACNKNVRS
jgi:hypothetical protein